MTPTSRTQWKPLLSLFCLLSGQAAYGQNVPIPSSSSNTAALAGRAARPGMVNTSGAVGVASHRPVNLDLSSSSATVSAASLVPTGNVSINVGNATQIVSPTSMLTPAEMLAVYQVVNTGAQSILLGSKGTAIGGSLDLSAQLSHNINSLVIPKGITAVSNVANTAGLTISGNLVNSGSLLAVSDNAAVKTAQISANNIYNNPNALISTVVPQGGVAGYSNLVGNLNLNLNTAHDLVNNGTISSAGNLSVTAGGAISNSVPHLSAGAAVQGVPSLVAAGDLSLISGAGQIVNSGLIQAGGSISIGTKDPSTNLTVDNSGGLIQALGTSGAELSGLINVRDDSYTGSATTALIGGDWDSKQLNVNGGSGEVFGNVGDVTGRLKVNAEIAHVYANTPNLTIGDCLISGDPSYVNAGGNITISGSLAESESLAIIASGDILNASGVSTSITNNDVNQGYDVYLIAGAKVTISGCTGCANSAGITVPSGKITAGTVQVASPGAGAGGLINLNNSNPNTGTLINTNGAASAGNIYLIALNNGAAGKGTVNISANTTITTAANPGNKAGDIFIYPASGTGSSVIGDIATGNVGASNPGGAITIKTGNAVFAGGGACGACVLFDQNGKITGTISAPSAVTGGNVTVGRLITGDTTNSTITMGAGTFTMSNHAQTNLSVNSTGTVNINELVDGNTLNITTTGDVSFSNSAVVAKTVSVSSGNNLTVGLGSKFTATDVTLLSKTISFSGSISATGTALLGGSGAVAINNTGGAGVFVVTPTMMSNITANKLTVTAGTNITVTSNINVSGSGAGAYNLALSAPSGQISGAGTFTLGNKTFDASSSSSLALANITAGDTTINLTSASSTVSPSTITAGKSTVNISGGSIVALKNVSLDTTSGSLTVSGGATGATTITQAASTSLAAGTIVLNSTNATGANNIGTAANPVAVSSTNSKVSASTASTTATIFVQNTSGGVMNYKSAPSSAGNVTLTATGAGGINFDGPVSSAAFSATTATGVITATDSSAIVTGSTSVTMSSTSGNLGTVGVPLQVTVGGSGNAINVGTTGNVFMNVTGSSIPKFSSTATFNNLTLTTDGFIETKTAINATNALSITTSGGNLNMDLGLGAKTIFLGTAGGTLNQTAGTVAGSTSVAIEANTIAAVKTATPSLLLAGGPIITNTGVVTVAASGTGPNDGFSLSNDNNITVTGILNGNPLGSKGFSFQTTANNGSITFNADVKGTPSISALTVGTGTVTVATGVTLQSTGQIALRAAAVNLNGTAKVDSATSVQVYPNVAGTTIGINGGAGAFAVPSSLISKIATPLLIIGSQVLASGDVAQAGSLTIDKSGYSTYELQVLTGGNYNGVGSTTTLAGSHDAFTVNATQKADIGTVNGTGNGGGSVNITGSGVTIQALGFSLNGIASASLTATGASGNIAKSAITPGTLQVPYLTLTTSGTTSNITGLAISTTSLTASTTSGNVSVDNKSSGVILGVANVNVVGSFSVTSDGPVFLSYSQQASVSYSLSTTGSITANSIGAKIVSPNISLTTTTKSPITINNAANQLLQAATSLNLSSAGGDIDVLSATPSLKVDTTGTANVSNATAGVLSLTSNGSTFAKLTVAADHGLTVGSALTAAGDITFTTANNGAVNVSGGNVTSNSGNVFITANGTGAINLSKVVSSLTKDVSLTSGSLPAFTGSGAPSAAGTVFFIPTAGSTVGVAGGAGTYTVTQAQLNATTAKTVQIGDDNSGNTASGTLTLAASGAGSFDIAFRTGGTFTASAATTINLQAHSMSVNSKGATTLGTVSGTGSGTLTVNADSISMTKNIGLGASSSALLTANTGAITNTGFTLTATNVSLNAFLSAIGAGGASPLTISSSQLTFSAGGNVDISNTGGVTLSVAASSSSGGYVSLKSNANISTTGDINAASSVGLVTTGGGVSLGGNVIGTDIQVTATGANAISQTGAFTITGANSVSLTSGSGDISGIKTSTKSLTLTSTGKVSITNSGAPALTLLASGSNFASLSVLTSGSLSTSSSITSLGALSLLTQNGGSISYSSSLNAGGTLTLTADTTGAITQSGAGLVSAPTVAATSGSGDITFTSINGSVTANTTGAVTMTAVGGALSVSSGTTLKSLSVTDNGGFSISTAGPITTSGGVTMNGVGTVSVGDSITAGTSISLTGNTVALAFIAPKALKAPSVSLTSKVALTVDGALINAASLSLSSTSAGITLTNSSSTTLSANAPGSVSLTSIATGGTVTLNSSSSSGSSFQLTLTGAGESLNIAGPVSGASVDLTVNSGNITQQAGADITGNTSVSLKASNGAISFGASVKATGGAGSVSITAKNSLTDASVASLSGNTLSLTSTSGNISLTNSGLTGKGGLTLDGATGVISTGGKLDTAALTVKGGTGAVTISDTNAASITATANGDISITDTGTGTINVSSSSSTAGNLSITTTGVADIKALTSLSAGKDLTLQAKNGSVSSLGDLTAGNNVNLIAGNGTVSIGTKASGVGVFITASGQLTDAALANIVASQSIGLTSTGADIVLTGPLSAASSITLSGLTGVSTSSNLSTASLILGGGGAITIPQTTASSITVTGTANVTVTDQNASTVTLGSVSGNTFSLSLPNAKTLNLNGTISAGTVSLTFNNANLTQSSGSIGATSSLTLVSSSGNVGTLGTSINTSAPIINLTVPNTVNISNKTTGSLTLNSFATFANLIVATDHDLNTGTNLTSTGTLNLSTSANAGSVALSKNVSGDIVSISANGAGTISGAGLITASTNLSLSSGSGDIGSSGTPLNTSTNLILGLGTSGSAYISNTVATGALLVNFSAPTFSNLTLTNNRDISTGNAVSVTNALSISTSANNGSIVIGGNTSAGTGSLTANGSGVITVSSGVTLTGITSLTLKSTSGDIRGAAALAAANLATPSLTVDTSGNVIVANTGNLQISNSGGTFASFTASSTQSLTAQSAIKAAGAVSLSSGNNGAIVVNAALTGASLVLNANGSGTINTAAIPLTASSQITLTSGSGSITASNLNTPSLLLGTTGDANVTNSSAGIMQLGSTGTKFNNLQVQTNNGLTTTSAIQSAGNLVLATSSGNLLVGASLAGGTVSLTTNAGSINAGSNTVSGTTSVTFTTTDGAVGDLGVMNVSTPSLIFQNLGATGMSANVSVSATPSVAVTFTKFTNLTLAADHSINALNSPLVVGTLKMSTANNGSIALVGAQASVVQLTANGTGSITASSNIVGLTSVSLSSGSGDISSISSSTDKLVVNTTGSVSIQNTNAGSLDFSGSSTFANIDLKTNHDLFVSAALNSTGNLFLSTTANSGSINLASTASGKTVSISAISAGNISAAGTITGSAGISLSSGSGTIGTNLSPINTSTASLTLNTTGDSNIANTTAAGLTLSFGGATMNSLTVSSNHGISSGNTLNATSINLSAANGGDITVNTSTLSMTLNTTGSITVNNLAGLALALTVPSVVSNITVSTNHDLNTVGSLGSNGILSLTTILNGGSISLGAGASAVNITLSADGAGSISSAGTINATGSLTMSSVSGDIGNVLALNTATPTLTLNTSGTSNINNTTSAGLTLSSSSTFANLTVQTNHGLTVGSNLFSAGTLSLSTANGGNISVGGNITGGATSLTAGGAGTLSASGAFFVSGTTVSLISGSGSIDLSTKTTDLTVGTTGAVILKNTITISPLNLTSTGSTYSSISVSNDSNLNTSNVINSTGLISFATTNGGSINLADSLNGGSVALNANSTGTIKQTSGTLSGSSISLISGSGDIQSISTQTAALTVGSTGNVSIVNSTSGGLTLASSGATFNSLDVKTNHDLSTSTSLSTVGNLILGTANNGGITFNADASGNNVSINANGSGGIQTKTGTVTGASSITFGSGSGDITVTIKANNLFIDSSGNADVTHIGNPIGSNLAVHNSASIFSSFSVKANQNLTIVDALNSKGAIVLSTSNNGDISTLNQVAGTTLLATANGFGKIDGNFAGSVSVGLNSSSGAIGSFSALSSTSQLTVSTSGAVTVSNTFASVLTLSEGAKTPSSITVSSDNGVTATGLKTASLSVDGKNGGVTLTNVAAGTLAVNSLVSATVTDTAAAVNLKASSATGGNFSLTMPNGALTVSGVLNAKSVNLDAAGAATVNAKINAGDSVSLKALSINLTAAVSAVNVGSSVTLNTPAALGDSQASKVSADNISLISGVSVNLTVPLSAAQSLTLKGAGGVTASGALNSPVLLVDSSNGNIGISNTNASTLTLNAVSGVATVTDTATGGTVNLSTSGISGLTVTLTGASESLVVVGPINATSGINLTANNGSVSQFDSAAVLKGSSVTLKAGSGSVNLNATVQANSVKVISSNSIGDAGLSFISTPALSLQSTAGNILLNANLTASTSVSLDGATGVTSNGKIFTGSLTVNSGAGAISIVDTDAGAVLATASGKVDLTLNALSTTLTANSSAAAVTVVANGNVKVQDAGAVANAAAGAYSLTTNPNSPGDGQITLNGNINASQITLQSSEATGGKGGIVWTAGVLTAPAVSLSDGAVGAGSKDIGSATSPILTSTGSLTTLTKGDVYVSDSSGGKVQLVSNQANKLSVSSTGSIEIVANPSANYIKLVATTSVSLSNDLSANPDTLTGNGGSILITASSLINNSAGTLSLNADGSGNGSGGQLDLTLSSISAPNNGTLLLSANGAGTGDGGSVHLSSAAGSLNLDSGSGSISIAASGHNGGSISVSAGTNLTVDLNNVSVAAGTNGNGGNIAFSAGSNLNFTNSSQISADGNGTGSGGSIILSADTLNYAGVGTTPLKLTANAGQTSGIAGKVSVSVGSSDITLTKNHVVASGIEIYAEAKGTGKIDFNNKLALNGVSIATKSNLVVYQSGVDVSNAALNGNGGNVVLDAGAKVNFIDTNTPAFSGGSATVATNGTGSGAGGFVGIYAVNGVDYLGSGSGPLKLSANGGTTGSGGIVAYQTKLPAVLLVGTSTTSNVQISAVGGSLNNATVANGGVIVVENGGAVTVLAGGANAGPLGLNGNGASYTFKAGFYKDVVTQTAGSGTSNLAIGFALTANGIGTGSGGNISLGSNSPTAMNIGLTKSNSNGVAGVISVSKGKTSTGANGSLSFENGSGAVILTGSYTAIANAAVSAYGDVNLGGSLGITTSKTAIQNTNVISLLSQTGNVLSKGVVSATNIALSAGATNGTIGTPTAAFKIATGVGFPVMLSAKALGTVNISNTGTGAMTLGNYGAVGQSGAGTFFIVSTAGSILTNSDIANTASGSTVSTVSLKATGNITLGGNLSTGSTTAGTVNLTGTAAVIDANATGTDTISAATININAGAKGSVGASGNPLRVSNVSNLSSLAKGGVNVNNNGAGALNVLKLDSASQFDLSTGGALNIKSANATITGMNLTAGGDITFSAAIGSSTKTVAVNIVSSAGSIKSLNATSILSGKNIVLNSSGTVGVGGATPAPFYFNSGASLKMTSPGLVNAVNKGTVTMSLLNSTLGSTLDLTSSSATVYVPATETVNVAQAVKVSAKSFQIDGKLASSAGTVTLIAAGAGNVIGNGSVVSTTGVSLSSASGTIGTTGSAFQLDSPVVTLSTAGLINAKSVFAGPVNLLFGSAKAAKTVAFTAAGDINITSAINTAATGFTLSTPTGALNLGANIVGSSAGTMSLTAQSITQSAGVLQGGALTLSASGDIKGSSGALNLNAAKSVAASSSTGLVNVNNSGTAVLSLLGSSAADSFSLTSASSVVIAANVTAPNGITITTTGTSHSITDKVGTELLISNKVTLLAGGANSAIGSSKVGVAVQAAEIGASTAATGTGLVNINSLGKGALLFDNSVSASTYTLKVAGDTTLNNISSGNGSLLVTATGGTLSTAASAVLSAKNGALTLNNTDLTNGKISIGAGSQITTSGKSGLNVSIIIGTTTTVPGTPVANVNYKVNGVAKTPPLPANTFFFGNKGISTTSPSTIDLSVLGGAKVIFNTDSSAQGSAAISVAGSASGPHTFIQADPPVGASAVGLLSGGSNQAVSSAAGVSLVAPPAVSGVGDSAGARVAMSAAAGTGLSIVGVSNGMPASALSSVSSALSAGLISSTAAAAMSESDLAGVRFSSAIGGSNAAGVPLASAAAVPLANAAGVSLANAAGLPLANAAGVLLASAGLAADLLTPVLSLDTELADGSLPAQLISDLDLGYKSGSVPPELGKDALTHKLKSSGTTRGQQKFDPFATLTGGVQMNRGTGRTLKLEKGSVLFAPLVDTVITTTGGKLHVDAGALVLVISFDGGLAVYDLDDQHAASVKLETQNGHKFHLNPGMSVVVSHLGGRSFDEVNPAQSIAYREIKSHLAGGATAYTAEFSVPSAMRAVVPLKNLLVSKHPMAKRLAFHLLKTTAANQQVHSRSGGFQLVPRKATTAWVR